jgi:hypothetical protein
MTPRRRTSSVAAVVAAAAAAFAGCATLPPTGVTANGQPLGLIVESQHYTVTQNQQVGQVQYRDAHGRSVGSANIYETRTLHKTNVEWQTTQGGVAIDEEDFHRITGDIETARRLHDTRVSGLWMNRIGLVLGAASVAAFVGGRVAKMGYRTDVPTVLGFLVGISLGGYGKKKAETPHAIELDRARTEIVRYNQQLDAKIAPPAPQSAPGLPPTALPLGN